MKKEDPEALPPVQVFAARGFPDERDEDYDGMAALSVTRGKQRKLVNAVRFYLEAHPEYELMPLRIDVVAIELDLDGTLRTIDHIEDAVRPDRR